MALLVLFNLNFNCKEVTEELECEHAIAILEECCGYEFAGPGEACEYNETTTQNTFGCDTHVDLPVIPSTLSACIQNLECADIEGSSLCELLDKSEYGVLADDEGLCS